jgi:hypothetical protein
MIGIDIVHHLEVHQDALHIVIMTDTIHEETIEIEIAIDQETDPGIVHVHEKTSTNEVEENQTTMTIDLPAKLTSVRKNPLDEIEIAPKRT